MFNSKGQEPLEQWKLELKGRNDGGIYGKPYTWYATDRVCHVTTGWKVYRTNVYGMLPYSSTSV